MRTVAISLFTRSELSVCSASSGFKLLRDGASSEVLTLTLLGGTWWLVPGGWYLNRRYLVWYLRIMLKQGTFADKVLVTLKSTPGGFGATRRYQALVGATACDLEVPVDTGQNSLKEFLIKIFFVFDKECLKDLSCFEFRLICFLLVD